MCFSVPFWILNKAPINFFFDAFVLTYSVIATDWYVFTLCESFYTFVTGDFHWGPSDNKSPLVSSTRLSILGDLNIAVVTIFLNLISSLYLSQAFMGRSKGTSYSCPMFPCIVRSCSAGFLVMVIQFTSYSLYHCHLHVPSLYHFAFFYFHSVQLEWHNLSGYDFFFLVN